MRLWELAADTESWRKAFNREVREVIAKAAKQANL
jgi:hypothetical protein